MTFRITTALFLLHNVINSQLARPVAVDQPSNIQNEVKQQIQVEKYKLYWPLPHPAGPLIKV